MSKDKYRRRAPALRLKNRVLVMCSAQTEETYFKLFKEKHKSDLRNVIVEVVAHKKSDPMAVVTATVSRKDGYDEAWAVFDKDDFIDFDEAITLAVDSGINCAFSNEAIEYWFFLHFENRTGAMSRKTLNSELGRKLNIEYDKSEATVRRVIQKISGRLVIAEERAQIGHERHMMDSGDAPSSWCSCTTIYALTKKLREWSHVRK